MACDRRGGPSRDAAFQDALTAPPGTAPQSRQLAADEEDRRLDPDAEDAQDY
jgi:hypothetical protein